MQSAMTKQSIVHGLCVNAAMYVLNVTQRCLFQGDAGLVVLGEQIVLEDASGQSFTGIHPHRKFCYFRFS